MKKYFEHCTTTAELKKAFRKAALETHPDHGGSNEAFKAMQAEYEAATERVARQEAHKAAEDARNKHQEETARTAEDFIREQEEFAAVIMQLINLEGLILEVCGNWLWITGETKQHKETIKGTGCRWSQNKKAWYWHPDGYTVRKHRKMSLDEIRALHGSSLIKNAGSKNSSTEKDKKKLSA